MSDPETFPIELQLGKAVRTLLHSQFFCPPPYPTQSFAGQTVIVTGSNVGLGLEAARHFYRLDCARLILGVRTVSKGEAAKEDIVGSVKHRSDADSIQVWPLDLTSTQSTLAFAERVKDELDRVDVLVENAGLISQSWTLCEGVEQTMQVNVVNTLLLGMALLPKLKNTKERFADSSPHLVVVTSDGHHFTRFKQINDPDIYQSLNDESKFDGFGW
jgi:NAD(P)-dependent dehydrogenase (short-subunit alcohol dehydrogenase family)